MLRWAVTALVALFTSRSVGGAAFGGLPDMLVGSFLTDNVLRFEGTGSFIGVFASQASLDGPIDIILAPDGRLYVAGAFSDNVLRFDGQTVRSSTNSSARGKVLRCEGTTGNFIVHFSHKDEGRQK